MSAYFHNPERHNSEQQVCDLSVLPLDLRRILSVQLREFIHHIEDVQDENELLHNPRVVKFLERCFGRAA